MKGPTQGGPANRAARDLAIQALEHWDPGDEEGFFDLRFPDSRTDPAVGALGDLDPFNWEEATREDKAELKARWLLFLRTDLPYRRPTHVWSWPFQDRQEMWDAAKAAGVADQDGQHPLFHTHRLRQAAAAILDRYLRGEISAKEVLSSWPKTELDPAISRFEYYDALLLRRDGKGSRPRAGHEALWKMPVERFRLFLGTDLRYAWDSLMNDSVVVVVLAGLLVFFGGPVVLLSGYRLFPHWAPGAWVTISLTIAWILLGGAGCTWASIWRLERRLRRRLRTGRLRHWPFESAEDLHRAATEATRGRNVRADSTPAAGGTMSANTTPP